MFLEEDNNNQSASDWAEDKIDDAKDAASDAGDAIKEDWEQTKEDVKDPGLDELAENKMLGREGDTSDDQ